MNDVLKLWLLSQSTVDCQIAFASFNSGWRIGTSIAHGLAPYLPWVIVVIGGLALIAHPALPSAAQIVDDRRRQGLCWAIEPEAMPIETTYERSN